MASNTTTGGVHTTTDAGETGWVNKAGDVVLSSWGSQAGLYDTVQTEPHAESFRGCLLPLP